MEKIISSNFKSFGKALEWLIAENEWEQQEFAEIVDLAPSTINKYISGSMNPPRPVRHRNFEEALGGKITEEDDGTWSAKLNKEVKEGVKRLDLVEDELNAYTIEKPFLDEISQELRFAQELIQRCLERIEKIDSQE